MVIMAAVVADLQSTPSLDYEEEEDSIDKTPLVPRKPQEGRSIHHLTLFAPQLDWTATLSPKKRSCIDLGNVEPCVHKAVANLGALKEVLKHADSMSQHSSFFRRDSLSKVRLRPISVQISSYSRNIFKDESELSVEGVRTGISMDRLSSINVEGLSGNEVIASVLRLVARLEHDRQDTLNSLSNEKERAQQLEEKLDSESERRLDLLAELVQAEYEQCILDVRDLKWHISIESRKLCRLLETQETLTKKNDELKEKVEHFKEMSPMLEEKLSIEKEKIRSMVKRQREVFDDLQQAQQTFVELEEKCHKTHLLADMERQKTQDRRNALTNTVDAAKLELGNAIKELDEVSSKLESSNEKILSLQKQATEIENRYNLSKALHSATVSRMLILNDKMTKITNEQRVLEQKAEQLANIKEAEHKKFEEAYSKQLNSLNEKEQQLRKIRIDRDNMEHQIDATKENIIVTKKKIASDKKTIERSRKELVRLDNQLEVSIAEFKKIHDEHYIVSEEFRDEKLKTEMVELKLRDTVEDLKKKLSEENKFRMVYENAIQANNTELHEMMTNHQQQLEELQKIASKFEKERQGKEEKISELEKSYAKKTKDLEVLKSELTIVEEEHATIDKELGGRKDALTVQEQKLKKEVEQKVNTMETLNNKMAQMKSKVEDLVKSHAGLVKLEASTSSAIDQLMLKLNVLEEKFTIEEKVEQGWKDEYKEIADFSSDANNKHCKYLKERHELLQKCETDLHDGITSNSKLAADYRQLQSEYIDIKMQALQVIERKLELETSLRDHKQLTAFQYCLFLALERLYRDRGSISKKNLSKLTIQFCKTSEEIQSLKEQYDTVIQLLHKFLEEHVT